MTKKKAVKKTTAPRKPPSPVAALSPRDEAAEELGCRPDELTFLLRTCDANLRGTHEKASHFAWPERGLVSAPDWDPRDCCGYGLHGLPRGEGSVVLLSDDSAAKWVVWAAMSSEVVTITVDGGGKSKAPRGCVVYVGCRDEAVALIRELHPGSACVYGTATAGARGTATAGDAGTATAGYGGTATAGYGGTATAGARGTATAGARGTATAGDAGTATAGDAGTATAGDAGTATAGDAGTATAGDAGSVSVAWWDYAAKRRRRKFGECGIDVLSHHAYRVTENGQWVDMGDVRSHCAGIDAVAAMCRSL